MPSAPPVGGARQNTAVSGHLGLYCRVGTQSLLQVLVMLAVAVVLDLVCIRITVA